MTFQPSLANTPDSILQLLLEAVSRDSGNPAIIEYNSGNASELQGISLESLVQKVVCSFEVAI